MIEFNDLSADTFMARPELPSAEAAYPGTTRENLLLQLAYLNGLFRGEAAAHLITAALDTSKLMTLEEERRAQAELARIDTLTMLGNRRALQQDYEGLQRQAGTAENPGRRLTQDSRESDASSPESPHTHSLLLIDVDRFKAVNTAGGHAAGDLYLRKLAYQLVKNTRRGDAFRWGGDEFAVLLPRTNVMSALIVAERARAGVEGLGMIAGQPASVSIGVGELVLTNSLEENIAAIDDALTEAKDTGRNRIVVAGNNPGESQYFMPE